MFSIKSTLSSRELTFTHHENDYFRVELKDFNFSATNSVWFYTDATEFNRFFQELNSHDKPWLNTRNWGTIEGDFLIEANCSSLGSVTFIIFLIGLQGSPEEWKVTAGLTTDFGQLEHIAKQSELFFGDNKIN